jgi:hypothetical protein
MRISRHAIGWLLIAYALVGIVIVVVGALIGLDLAGRVERLASNANETLTAAARATETAADSFADVDTSLAEARTSSDAAAALARDASGTLNALAIAMELSVLGAQPLQPLAAEFETSADQAAELANTLDSVGASLGDTRTNVARIGPQLSNLSDRLTSLGAPPDGSSTAVGSPPLRLLVVVVLAWVVMQSVGSLFAGLALVRYRAPD